MSHAQLTTYIIHYETELINILIISIYKQPV